MESPFNPQVINLLAPLLDTPTLLLPLPNLSALLLARALLRVAGRKGRCVSLRCGVCAACLIPQSYQYIMLHFPFSDCGHGRR